MNLSGSVRADLTGGTLDLYPINRVLESVRTLNVALGLKANVELNVRDDSQVVINSVDYNKKITFSLKDLNIHSFYKDGFFSTQKFEELTFVAYILRHFNLSKGLEVNLKSQAPAGSGLGGSSSLGVTLFKALAQYQKQSYSNQEIIEIVRNAEALILGQGIPGYQDYYPALFGGVLSLNVRPNSIEVEQLFSKELQDFLESNCHLVYSNKSRLSGINNWKAYKNFFEEDNHTRNAFLEISKCSQLAYDAVTQKDFSSLKETILREGQVRDRFFPGFVNSEMKEFEKRLLKVNPQSGIKVCGAGGGGCFLVFHENEKEVKSICNDLAMELLEFSVEKPL